MATWNFPSFKLMLNCCRFAGCGSPFWQSDNLTFCFVPDSLNLFKKHITVTSVAFVILRGATEERRNITCLPFLSYDPDPEDFLQLFLLTFIRAREREALFNYSFGQLPFFKCTLLTLFPLWKFIIGEVFSASSHFQNDWNNYRA